MSPEECDIIQCLSQHIECLSGLTPEIIFLLRMSVDYPFLKFSVTLEEYKEWRAKEPIEGVDYDLHSESLIIKARPCRLREKVTDFAINWLRNVSYRLSHTSGSTYRVTRGRDDVMSDYIGDSRLPDGAIIRALRKYPLVVLKVGIRQSTKMLLQQAEEWLQYSNGQTRLVVIIDIQEMGPCELTKWIMSNSLPESEILQTDIPELMAGMVMREIRPRDATGLQVEEPLKGSMYFCLPGFRTRGGPQKAAEWEWRWDPDYPRVQMTPEDHTIAIQQLLPDVASDIVFDFPLKDFQYHLSWGIAWWTDFRTLSTAYTKKIRAQLARYRGNVNRVSKWPDESQALELVSQMRQILRANPR